MGVHYRAALVAHAIARFPAAQRARTRRHKGSLLHNNGLRPHSRLMSSKGKSMLRSSLLIIALAAPVAAETEAPAYYAEALFAVSTAETLVNFCPAVGLDTQAVNAAAESVLNRLAEDGIGGDAIVSLTGVEEAVAALQAVFTARHGLDQPSEAVICAAARSEIAADSAIGQILTEGE